MIKHTDIIIVGTGAAGLFCALKLPSHMQILMLTKEQIDESDSFLAQGGICMLRGEEDFEDYLEDTMKAGHYENKKESVEVMIRTSPEIISDLIDQGVEFEHTGNELTFTREGGHSTPRIVFHEDITGREITSKLIKKVQEKPNVTILEHTMMVDIICDQEGCYGIVACDKEGNFEVIQGKSTVLACGGLGGLYQHTTNFRHITGDALAIALRHNIPLEHLEYIQIHPTTLYSEKPGRRFLISESVRGEGAVLLNQKKERFVNELLPRDLVTQAIHKQMEIDGNPYVWLSMENIPEEEIKNHFPNIYKRCLEEGWDVTKESIPVVPAQHYFMGGIQVDLFSRTSKPGLYAIGETSCNGVHGANRLASNSLLESLVFAKRAAADMEENIGKQSELFGEKDITSLVDLQQYQDVDKLQKEYHDMVLDEIEKEKKRHE